MGLFSWMKRRFAVAFVEARGLESVADNIKELANHARRMHHKGDVDDLKKAIKSAVRKYKRLKITEEKQKLINYLYKECKESADFLQKEMNDMVRIFSQTEYLLVELRNRFGKQLYENLKFCIDNDLSAVDSQAARNIKNYYNEVIKEINTELRQVRSGARRTRRRRSARGKARWMRFFVAAERTEREIAQDAEALKDEFRKIRDEFSKLKEAETIDVSPKLVEAEFKRITGEMMEILAFIEEIMIDYFITVTKIRKEAVNGMLTALKPVEKVNETAYQQMAEIPRAMDKQLKATLRYAYRVGRRGARTE
ncbi:MAG: hypothetical protein ACE5FT_04640 [Candidatus Nanoarchaeia archaeon]